MTATLIFVNKITCLTVNSEYSYGKYVSVLWNLQQEIISFNKTATKIQSYQ